MAWKPRLPPAGTEVVPMERRKWVAVAESHAEQAVNLFVNIMKNQKLPYKMRMEAATRIVMIAGATFRGEKVDGNGRPAANLPGGKPVTRLNHDALRSALAQLPPGAVIESPEELAEGEVAVVLVDSEHNRKPTGMVSQTTLGATVIGEADPEEAARLKARKLQSREEEEVVKLAQKAEQKRVVTDPIKLVDKLFKQGGKAKEVETVNKMLGDKGYLGNGQKEAERLSTRGNPATDGSRSSEAGQEPELADSDGLEGGEADAGEVP